MNHGYGNNSERIVKIAKHKEDKYYYFQLKVSAKLIDFR
ncbi:Protein CBG22263 [Caenorhabditis briggsae]|uniref:Protein CBG22263 n=1 Tax=Caenorhabditis briggsae TaxID=6238 RepID=A8Y1X5_CAEBR|nr:Protein CBG22263 [Caenorhabditis briggsae]CAP38895.2 Protein CBG22263 [Caenorhabditis briggsae]